MFRDIIYILTVLGLMVGLGIQTARVNRTQAKLNDYSWEVVAVEKQELERHLAKFKKLYGLPEDMRGRP